MAAKLVFTVFACLIAFQAVCADSDSSPEEVNNNYFSRWGSRLGGLFNRFGGNQQQRGGFGFGYNSNNNRNGAQAGLRLGANHEQDGRARLGTTWNYRNNAAEQHQADSSDSSDSSEHNNVNHQKDGRARLGATWNYRNNAAKQHQADSGDSSDSSEHVNVNHQKDGRARLGATWNYRNNAAKQHQADSGDSSDSSEHDSGYQHEKKQSLQVSAKMSKAVTITDVLTVSSLHCASNNVKKVGEASRSITASLRALLSVRASATSKDDEESQIKEAAWASASTRLEIATEMLQQAAKSMERLLRGADASSSSSSSSSSGSSEEPKRDQSLNDWDNQEDNSSYSSGGW